MNTNNKTSKNGEKKKSSDCFLYPMEWQSRRVRKEFKKSEVQSGRV